jgi:hypothetical protein
MRTKIWAWVPMGLNTKNNHAGECQQLATASSLAFSSVEVVCSESIRLASDGRQPART